MHFIMMLMMIIIMFQYKGSDTSRMLSKTGENENLYFVSGKTFQHFTILYNINSN